jgi:BirA family biotin operon repressor/biotin-[acetyl-CoA-carboxylase] ligase
LTENGTEVDRVKYVIIGIGVDVNLNARDFPPELKIATSLKIESGKASHAPVLAINILRGLDTDYRLICSNEFEKVAENGKTRKTIGEEVSFALAHAKFVAALNPSRGWRALVARARTPGAIAERAM